MQKVSLATKNILVVDDDDACQYMAELIVEELECSCEVAVNGQEAVDKVRFGKFDVVLMDLRMPVMDGFEATRMIRQTHKDLPVIAVTGNAMAWEEGKCQASGMNDCLIKPFREEQLGEMLLKWTS
jgi:CheY-like chemotaxis protein